MPLWYLRRAVPWTSLVGCLAVAAGLSAVVRLWDVADGLAVLAAVLVAAAAAAFVHDEPALAVTTVAPRGGRWAAAWRSAAIVVPLATCVALGLVVRSEIEVGDWALVAAGTGAAVAFVALLASRRRVPRVGGAIASLVVLLGIAPLVLEQMVGLRLPYPSPGLTDGLTVAWAAVAGVATVGLVVATVGPEVRR